MSFFNTNDPHWTKNQKLLLRFFTFYFIIQVVPLDWKFYRELFSIKWSALNFYDLFSLTRYTPVFFSFTGYANWAIAALIALLATVAYSFVPKKTEPDDNKIYYLLRAILRYRLAAGVIAYGLIKLFPLQMPYPSLSNLHTNYGDFLPWKIYFHTLGIAQPYESFLGAVEVFAGLLLLFRRTTTFGAGIIIGFIGNAFGANLAYQIGEQVYTAYLTVIALFLFIYDLPRLYNLLVLQRYTLANPFRLSLDQRCAKLKSAFQITFVVFLLGLAISTYANYHNAAYKIPQRPGLSKAYGFYNVREFRLNGRILPYSDVDTTRWQNVVFEKWATISIKTARHIDIDRSRGDGFHADDLDRNYESAGVGDRRYFSYEQDSTRHLISLINKNKKYSSERYRLSYQRPNDSTIILNGVNEKKDSVYAVLEKINRKYMLLEGRRKPIKL